MSHRGVGGVYVVHPVWVFGFCLNPVYSTIRMCVFFQPVQWAWHQGNEHWCVCRPFSLGTQFSMSSFKGCVNFVECHFCPGAFQLVRLYTLDSFD